VKCSFCGNEVVPLGQLGSMTHYRCRFCGIECSEKLPSDDEPGLALEAQESFRPAVKEDDE
jgi:DNA-directed RNA polymerase subunit RPC12/RpoP